MIIRFVEYKFHNWDAEWMCSSPNLSYSGLHPVWFGHMNDISKSSAYIYCVGLLDKGDILHTNAAAVCGSLAGKMYKSTCLSVVLSVSYKHGYIWGVQFYYVYVY